MNEIDVLSSAGQMAVDEIRNQIDDLGLNATGKAKESVSFTVTGSTLYIQGLERILYIIFGRSGGKPPPVENIKQWVEIKLGVSSKESRGVAFAISNKIAKEGTNIFTGKAKGIEIEVVYSMLSDQIVGKILDQYSEVITGGIIKEYEKRS